MSEIDHIRVGYIVEDEKGNVLFANYDSWIQVSDTILGVSWGIQGMQVGEERTLFIHPRLGYGALTTLPSCTSLNVKVYILDAVLSYKKLVSTLKPLDLSWINDPIFYGEIESSIDQIPLFRGSFYRDWLD